MLELEAAFQLYSLLADEDVVHIEKSHCANVGDLADPHTAPIAVQCSVQLAAVSIELAKELARIQPALAIMSALLDDSSSQKCETSLHSEELDWTAEELSARLGKDRSLWLELDSAVAEIVEKQNQLVELVVEVARLQKENSAAAENPLLQHSTKDRILQH